MPTKTKKVAKKISNDTKGKTLTPKVQESESVREWKIAQNEYDKYFKLGMKYAREYNKIVLEARKTNTAKDNREQTLGWTDGFVEAALGGIYDGMTHLDYDHYPNAKEPNASAKVYDSVEDWADEA